MDGPELPKRKHPGTIQLFSLHKQFWYSLSFILSLNQFFRTSLIQIFCGVIHPHTSSAIKIFYVGTHSFLLIKSICFKSNPTYKLYHLYIFSILGHYWKRIKVVLYTRKEDKERVKKKSQKNENLHYHFVAPEFPSTFHLRFYFHFIFSKIITLQTRILLSFEYTS